MYVFLAAEYKRHNVTMQLHLNVRRNACTRLFESVGPDAGGDCVGDPIPGATSPLCSTRWTKRTACRARSSTRSSPRCTWRSATTAGSFRGVVPGAAWWFCDHKRGMEEQMNILAETGHLAQFLRHADGQPQLPFLRAARLLPPRAVRPHRRGSTAALLSEAAAMKLLRRLCVENSRALFA